MKNVEKAVLYSMQAGSPLWSQKPHLADSNTLGHTPETTRNTFEEPVRCQEVLNGRQGSPK